MIRQTTRLLSLLALLVTAACGTAPPDRAAGPDPVDVTGLTRALTALGPEIDPAEAERLARISHEYTLQLREEYRVSTPPLVHNTKVNLGLRDRGLCFQWADDLEARLRQEGFRTIEFHRAIANSNSILIDHSTLIVSRPGDSMFEGIVLDGWRNGGDLFWSPTLEDERYVWVPRDVVFAEQLRRRGAR